MSIKERMAALARASSGGTSGTYVLSARSAQPCGGVLGLFACFGYCFVLTAAAAASVYTKYICMSTEVPRMYCMLLITFTLP